MTFHEFMDKVLAVFPEAVVEADNDNQIIVCTNLTIGEDGMVVPFVSK